MTRSISNSAETKLESSIPSPLASTIGVSALKARNPSEPLRAASGVRPAMALKLSSGIGSPTPSRLSMLIKAPSASLIPTPNPKSKVNSAAIPPSKLRPMLGNSSKSKSRFRAGSNVREKLKSHWMTPPPSGSNISGMMLSMLLKLVSESSPRPFSRRLKLALRVSSSGNASATSGVTPSPRIANR